MTRRKSSLERTIKECLEEHPEIGPLFNAGVDSICAQLEGGKVVSMGPYNIDVYMGSPQQEFHNGVDYLKRRARRNGYELNLDVVGCDTAVNRDEEMDMNFVSIYFTVQKK